MKSIERSASWSTLKAALLIFAVLGLASCGKTYSRDEFSKLVMNKTEAEVKAAVGEPRLVKEGNPMTWTYYHKTYNPKDQNQEDYRVTLQFAPDPATGQQRVVDVSFSVTAA